MNDISAEAYYKGFLKTQTMLLLQPPSNQGSYLVTNGWAEYTA